MRTIVINSTNLVPGTNSTYSYKFPANQGQFKNHQVAVLSVSMLYSWPNVSQYVWPIGSSNVTKTVTVPPGFYDIPTLNQYLLSVLVADGHYLLDAAGNILQFVEIVMNPVFYGIQINCYAVPSTLGTYQNPANLTLPNNPNTTQFLMPNTKLQQMLGFTAGSYPTVPQTTTYSATSSFTPQVTPVQSLIMTNSLINNRISNPSTVFYTFSPAGVKYGGLIVSTPAQPAFCDVQDGIQNEMVIQFYDQNLNLMTNILDSNICIMLMIRQKGED